MTIVDLRGDLLSIAVILVAILLMCELPIQPDTIEQEIHENYQGRSQLALYWNGVCLMTAFCNLVAISFRIDKSRKEEKRQRQAQLAAQRHAQQH